MVMMVVLVVVVIVIIVVMVALALRIVALLAVLVMVMVVMMLVLLILIMVVVMMVLVLLVLIVVMMVMVALAFGVVALVLVVVMVVMVLVLHLLQLVLEAVFVHGFPDLLAAQLRPGGGDETGLGVEGLEDLGGLEGLLGLCGIGAAHDDEVSVGNLVVEKLAEVAGVHLGLAGVHDRDLRADVGAFHALDGSGHVGQLAHARGLDEDAVGGIVVHDLLEGLGKVAHQGAADAAGVHLRDLHARVLQKAAVNGDLTELVFDEDQFFILIPLRDQLADEGRFPRAEKAGEDVYSCHGVCFLPCYIFQKCIISPLSMPYPYKKWGKMPRLENIYGLFTKLEQASRLDKRTINAYNNSEEQTTHTVSSSRDQSIYAAHAAKQLSLVGSGGCFFCVFCLCLLGSFADDDRHGPLLYMEGQTHTHHLPSSERWS